MTTDKFDVLNLTRLLRVHEFDVVLPRFSVPNYVLSFEMQPSFENESSWCSRASILLFLYNIYGIKIIIKKSRIARFLNLLKENKN